MVEMELVGVRVELPGNTPVVLLREVADAPRLLPIFIGQPEATAIAFAMDGVVPPRPMTHDLFAQVLVELGASIDRIVITAISEGTFYADLHLKTGDSTSTLSCRPSDAIALAVRLECPIYASEEVLDDAALPERQLMDGDGDSEEVVEAFREFIDSVDPEDFAS